MSDPACFQSAIRSRHVTLSRFKKQTAVTYLYTTKNRLTYIQIKNNQNYTNDSEQSFEEKIKGK